LGALGGYAVLDQAAILRTMATLWIVSDPIDEADVAVVLGGGIDVRPFEAAELYRKGLVKKVLISQVADDRAAKIGAAPGHTEVNRRVLLRQGVPAEAIETFGTDNATTRDEALALKDWIERHSIHSIIVPTESFSARRVRWTMHRILTGRNVRIEVPAFDPPQYSRATWWKSSGGPTSFVTEVIKYIYYRISY
jgi:uncharacterized SAM-binding protein YcdF (DUF218 family)